MYLLHIKEKVISLLELVLNKCVFSCQENSTINSKVLQLVPLYVQSMPTFTWNILKKEPKVLNAHTYHLVEKKHVDDIISIGKKEQVDTLFNHLNSVDPHINGSISFLNTKCSPNSDHTMHTTIYRKPTHPNHYQDWNSNHQISARKVVIHALFTVLKIFVLLPNPC